MFTLLPEQHKKKLWKQYRMRLVSFFCFFVTAVFLIAIGFLFPSYLSLSLDKNTLSSDVSDLESKISIKNSKGLKETLDQIKTTLSLVKPDETSILNSIQIILKQMPGGISVQSINYIRGQGAPSSITISGIASERDNLISFTKQLQKELSFTNVTLPVSNLAKEFNVPFSLTILGKF